MPETPSGYLPDLDVQWDLQVAEEHNTQVLRSPNGREQRRPMFPNSGLLRWTCSTKFLELTDKWTLYTFLRAKRGKYTPFYAYRPDPEYLVDWAVGSVTAATSLIIPFKETTVTVVKVGGGAGVSFTVTAGAGAGGEDRINFTAGAQTGAVTVTLTGRRRVVVRSDMDAIAWKFMENVANTMAVFQLALQEVV